MEHPFWSTSGRTIPISKELQRLWRNTDTSRRRQSKQGLDRSSYQEFTSGWKQGQMIQKFEEDGSQRDGATAV